MNKEKNKEIIKKYIEDNLSKGFQISKIKEKLLNAGYDLNEVDEVINALQNKRKKTSNAKKLAVLVIIGIVVFCILSFFILVRISNKSTLKNEKWIGRIYYISKEDTITECNIFSNFACAQKYSEELKTFDDCKRILSSEIEIEICRILLLGDESLCRNLPHDQYIPLQIWENECFQRMAILKQDSNLCNQLKDIDLEKFRAFNSTSCIERVSETTHVVFVQYR